MEGEQFRLYEVGIVVIFVMQRSKHPIFSFLAQLRTLNRYKNIEDVNKQRYMYITSYRMYMYVMTQKRTHTPKVGGTPQA
jgi:hypothetical protein